ATGLLDAADLTVALSLKCTLLDGTTASGQHQNRGSCRAYSQRNAPSPPSPLFAFELIHAAFSFIHDAPAAQTSRELLDSHPGLPRLGANSGQSYANDCANGV